MKEVKTTLKRMALYYLLLAINILPCANVIADRFPTRNSSTIYLLILSVCLVMYYAHRVVKSGALSLMMRLLSWMGLLLILLRGIKYSAFAEVGVLARHTWYLYYVPMLLMPLLLFYISLLVSPKRDLGIPKGWFWVSVITIILIAFVLTNDSHQLVFSFHPHFENWDNDYTHGWLFYVITVWQYALYLTAIGVLIIKCRISSAKKNAWIMLIPFGIGVGINSLLLSETMPKLNGTQLIQFPEALIFTVAIELECCMQLGLIPTNTDYGKLFQKFSIAAQIADKRGTPIYASSLARPLTAAQFALDDASRIGEHTVLHKMPIPGGFGFWQDDMTALDRLNDELAEAKENLAQEAELIRLRNDLKEKETKIEQRTLVYDTIAKRTQRQSQAISRLAESARQSNDIEFKEASRKQITLLGAYIKRYANLMLLSQEQSVIAVGELGISVSEVLRYLNFCGIPSEFINNADGTVSADTALTVFEAFEALLEANYKSLRGAFVNLSEQGNTVAFKLTLEHATAALSDELEQHLSSAGINCEIFQEEDVSFSCFALPKGGEV